MHLLILEEFAEVYKKALEPKFPDLSIHAASCEEEVGDFIGKTDILVTIQVSDDLIKRAVNLKWVQALTTGVNFLTSLPSLRKDILLTSTRGIHGPQLSEMAILLMISLSRNFQQIIRNQDKRSWERWPAKLISRKKVGILGVGVCGEAIAQKCKAFGMTVYGINRVKRQFDSVDYSYGSDGLLEVIGEVDYFVIVVPSTPQTRGMVSAEALSRMKPTAFLINLGRGEVVDEEALLHTLKKGKIAGAALDVFCVDPLPEDHPFWGMENVIVTPRVSGMTDIYPQQALPILEENLRRFLKMDGQELINLQQW